MKKDKVNDPFNKNDTLLPVYNLNAFAKNIVFMRNVHKKTNKKQPRSSLVTYHILDAHTFGYHNNTQRKLHVNSNTVVEPPKNEKMAS